MRKAFPIGVAFLIIASGTLTAISGIPFLDTPAGMLRDQNFNPVPAQALAIFALQSAAFGLVIALLGAMFVIFERWSILWAGVILALCTFSLYNSFFASTGPLLVTSLMGVSGGFLGILPRVFKMTTTIRPVLSLGNWLTSLPYALLITGMWESGVMLLGCSPPVGSGSGCGELLGPAFYIIAFIIGGVMLSTLGVLAQYGLHRKPKMQGQPRNGGSCEIAFFRVEHRGLVSTLTSLSWSVGRVSVISAVDHSS